MADHDLAREIEREAEESFRAGRSNHVTDLVLVMGAIFLSVAASIVAGIHQVPAPLVASIAAAPPLFGSLRAAVDFKGRAAWYFRKSASLRALAMRLEYSADPVVTRESVAKLLGELLLEMEDQWPAFVSEKMRSATRSMDGP